MTGIYASVAAVPFLGVGAFFGVAFFPAAFFGAAFFAGAAGLAVVLVTRPDLVLPSTFSTGTIAGAAVGALRLVAVLAFGLDAAVFLGAGAFFVAGAALALVVVVLLAVVDFFGAPAFLAALGAADFCAMDASDDNKGKIASMNKHTLVTVVVEGFSVFSVSDLTLASFLASFTGPDGPND